VEKTELAAAMVKTPLAGFVRATTGYDTTLLSATMHYYTWLLTTKLTLEVWSDKDDVI